MMTFEKVLEVFKDYLAVDTNCEVVLTKHGYTVMQWDEKSKDWYGVEYCETPEDLRDELLSSYRMSKTEKMTKIKQGLTEDEKTSLETEIQNFIYKCKN